MTSSIWLNDLASYVLQAALLVGVGALLARLFRLRACTLFPQLGVHIGDMITEQVAQQVRQMVSNFDAQFRATFHTDEKGNVTLVIVGR